jgi:hypothetical protein
MPFSSVPRLWHRFWKQPLNKRALLLEAVFWLVAARLAIFFLPFPRIAHYLGELRPPLGGEREFPQDQSIARDISWAIDRSARLFPFRVVCLPRALAGWQMLHRRRVAGQVHFGASRVGVNSGFRTHAWLDASGVEVTGYPEAYECVEIGYFAR